MSDRQLDAQRAARPFKLILIDNDPIFRLGLRMALEPFPALQVVAQSDSGAAALETLVSSTGTENTPDLVVLELGLGSSGSDRLPGLQLCGELKAQYPNLPVFLLTWVQEPAQLAAAKATGADGYCLKGTDISVIAQALCQVASGEAYWSELVQTQNIPSVRGSGVTQKNRSLLLLQMRRSGLGQIEEAIAQVAAEIQNPNLSNLDWLILTGRLRELRASRWLVNQLLPVVGSPEATRKTRDNLFVTPAPARSADVPPANPQPSAVSPQPSALSATLNKIQYGVQNLTGAPLEIDILRDEKKRELLYLILDKLQDVLDELRLSQVPPEAIAQKRSLILRNLWQQSTTDFFGKYYTLQIGNLEVDIVNTLLRDVLIVQTSILDKIPFLVEMITHLLFQTPLTIENAVYSYGTPEARQHIEFILENLVIQVANSVVQPLLNYFADVEAIKQGFYTRRLISSREIARFRNDLSWKYRREIYIEEPKAIFESRYILLTLNGIGIRKISIYAPRAFELEQLTGLQLAVTLLLETRDAIAPRIRASVAFLGSGVVYILTQVIGRAIGLVGRGVIQGIGTTLQETRFGKNSQRQK
jgi:DNA-binding NarL/FixJ family response regulator